MGRGVTARKVRTCLWFNDQALPAAELYCGLLPESGVEHVERYPEGHEMGTPGSVASVEFRLSGAPYLAVSHALTAFDDLDRVQQWFDSASPALGGDRPIDLCDTFEGRRAVDGIVRKIQCGEFP